MARRNARGLELSFKRSGNGTTGRWFKTIGGREVYFGAGNGISDRESYRTALEGYRRHIGKADDARKQNDRNDALMALVERGHEIDKPEVLRKLVTLTDDTDPLINLVTGHFANRADKLEKRNLLRKLSTLPLPELRTTKTTPTANAKTVRSMLDEFVADQRRRMDSRKKMDERRANGENVQEGAKQFLSPARFVSILRDVKTLRDCVGKEAWDGSEATAARITKKYRSTSEEIMHDGENSPNTFNDRRGSGQSSCLTSSTSSVKPTLLRPVGLAGWGWASPSSNNWSNFTAGRCGPKVRAKERGPLSSFSYRSRWSEMITMMTVSTRPQAP